MKHGLSDDAFQLLLKLVGSGPTDGPIVDPQVGELDLVAWNSLLDLGYVECCFGAGAKVLLRATFEGKKQVAIWRDQEGKRK